MFIKKCSTIGARANPGRYVKAPNSNTVVTNRIENVIPLTGKAPGPAAINFFFAREPAKAMIGKIIKNRPASMVIPRVLLYQQVFAVSPAKALPLFAPADVNA